MGGAGLGGRIGAKYSMRPLLPGSTGVAGGGPNAKLTSLSAPPSVQSSPLVKVCHIWAMCGCGCWCGCEHCVFFGS